MTNSSTVLRLGTRGSLLARVQSQMVADLLEKKHPGLKVRLELFKTTGDQIADRPLHEAGGKGLFVKELEQALLDERVDFAVHSFKDVPVTMPLVEQANLIIAAVPEREDPRDVLATSDGRELSELIEGARVGTGSMRRQVQLANLRSDLRIEGIRGNIDTRLKKLRAGEFEGVVLAMSGLKRAGLFDGRTMKPLPVSQFIPAAGQGALALQCRKDDPKTIEILRALHHQPSALCVEMEREVVRKVDGDCFSPVAALATLDGKMVTLRTAIGARGGALPILRGEGTGPATDSTRIVEQVYQQLEKQGVYQHLHA